MYRFCACFSYVILLAISFSGKEQISAPALLSTWFILWLIGTAADAILNKLARASEKGE